MRRSIDLIQQLNAIPTSLEESIKTMQLAAIEIDRLLSAITNAQSALTYAGMSLEDRITTALGSLSFGDQ